MITMLLSLLCACVCVTAGKPHLYFSNFAAPGPSPVPPAPCPYFRTPLQGGRIGLQGHSSASWIITRINYTLLSRD